MISFVPTPIGNRDDITLRAIATLGRADLIACEDTRHSAPLLSHHGIADIPLTPFHEHNVIRVIPSLIAQASEGKNIVVISDAGMPAISDPGYRLIQACLEADIPYEVLPGPSAVLTALVGSGFPTHAFCFAGFLPVKKGKRLQAMSQAMAHQGTAIFFESPHRLTSTLKLLAANYPDLRCCVARELTKKFETYHRGTATELLHYFQTRAVKGEIVLLLDPNSVAPQNQTRQPSQSKPDSPSA